MLHTFCARLVLGVCLVGTIARAETTDASQPTIALRVLTPTVLEMEIVAQRPVPEKGLSEPWYLASPMAPVPAAAAFTVKADGRDVTVQRVGFKRRAVRAPLRQRDLRVATWVYLQLAESLPMPTTVVVRTQAITVAGQTEWTARATPDRSSSVIHVNQEGYAPDLPKRARVGYYLGDAGELPLVEGEAFAVVRDRPGFPVVFNGTLQRQREQGYTYSPAPYQAVWVADFSALQVPGVYRVRIPGLGLSTPFRVDAGTPLNFARAYALGIYHQRCGQANELPFTRFTHAACHVAPASVPEPTSAFSFTWTRLAQLDASAPGKTKPVTSETPAAFSPRYPFVRGGARDVSGGHHDAGDYSKYTTNSASFVHTLVFAVDALRGVDGLDQLGLPESGDGVPDLLQEAKIEADFLAKLQDDDGGFYFLVYPRDRPYESDVLPDRGDPQVVWPKNTAATAAAVAALAQASSSPHFRRHFPDAAASYLERAKRGWVFLRDAIAKHGRDEAYQRLTHYGDVHGHNDELAWAACELFIATGDEEYHDRFREWCDPSSPSVRRWGWWRMNEAWGNAIRSYAFAARSGRVAAAALDRDRLAACEREIEAAARDALRWSEASAYGTSFPEPTKRMRGGGWYFSLDQAFDLAVASQLDFPKNNDPRGAFLAAFVANLDYEAGANPVNRSYLTGLGQGDWQTEIVHQYALNDRRVLPPSGLPLGNVQSGQPYLDRYKGELGAMSYPEDGAREAPYAFYDRWTDTYNVATEFVMVNQARALAGLAWLAARHPSASSQTEPIRARIEGLPEVVRTGTQVVARWRASGSVEEPPVEVVWEAREQAPSRGREFAFVPRSHGKHWVEAEARWADGRRAFAVGEFAADNGKPEVTVVTKVPLAKAESGQVAVLEFRRSGDLSSPLKVAFELKGTATKWLDYRRPEGDMPGEVTIPAGSDRFEMSLRAVAEGLKDNTRHLLLVLKPGESYNLQAPHAVVVTLMGPGAHLDRAHAPPMLPRLPE